MRILINSQFFLFPPTGGIRRNIEVLKIWRKYADEIIYVPTLDDLRKIRSDENIRKNFHELTRHLRLTVPDKVMDLINNDRNILDLPERKARIISDIEYNFLYYKYNHKIAKYLGKIDADVYYAQQQLPQMVHFLSEIATNRNIGALVYIESFCKNLFEDIKHYYKAYSSVGFISIPYAFYMSLLVSGPWRWKWRELITEGRVKFAFSVSEDLSSYYPFMKGLYTKVLRPANAFDKKLLELRGRGKEDYGVFYARLVPVKGILEIPKIAKKLKKKIIVMGQFGFKMLEERFIKEKNEYIEYVGYVSRNVLEDIVSKAKLLIYPSHMDSFSLVILEALAMGTPVVSYRIPGIRSVYKNLSAVKLVEEGNIEEIVNEAKRIFSMPKEEYENMINNRKLLEFLEEHNSWEKVALTELEELKKITNKK